MTGGQGRSGELRHFRRSTTINLMKIMIFNAQAIDGMGAEC
jgi:hypothetical protein